MTAHGFRVAVVMPVFNEQDGIEAFLRRIDLRAIDDSVVIVCVDDSSEDSSAARISQVRDAAHPIILVRRDINGGHGPATVMAWAEGVALGAEWIVTTDSDGHVDSGSLGRLLEAVRSDRVDVVEGHRGVHSRSVYRRLVSSLLPAMLLTRARSWCPDSNTPYRAYRSEALSRLITLVPAESKVPNLWMTVLVRRAGLSVSRVTVRNDERLVDGMDGSAWRSAGGSKLLPQRRFVRFCVAALVEWWREWPAVRGRISTRG